MTKTHLILIVIWAFILMHIIFGAIDESVANQERMLCNSAKVSGNEIYLNKCICFYNGEDIRCIEKGY